MDFKIGDEIEAEVLETTEDGNIVFETDSFSIYAVVDDGNTGENARMTLEFYNGTTLRATMYVKNSDVLLGDDERDNDKSYLEDIVYDPGIGDALSSGQTFRGWYIDETNESVVNDPYDADVTPMTIEEVREWISERTITENETIRVYAVILKYFNITYYGDSDKVSLGTITEYLKRDETSTTHKVSMAYTADSHQDFKGWKATEATYTNIDGATTKETVYPNGQEITITGDIVFNVYAPNGNWLVYNTNGKGGTYNAPQFYLTGETTTPSVNATAENMKRYGFTFGGWYKDADCTDGNEFSFGGTLTDNTNIYAKWIANTTGNYTVLIWKQNAARDGYDFAASYAGTGPVGESVKTQAIEA